VFFAGEPLMDTFVERWRRAFPQAGEIVNLYGPTETTLAKCFYRVETELLPGVQPIGWPLPETQVLVLAENGQMCGIGEAGEIVLRTPFRTLGYINAPTETQLRFAKNPFRSDERDLLYYTGDRGRYRPDGSVDILGHVDDQVKIRGIRIEPLEIEAVLGQHPRVLETVVLAWEHKPGDKRLVAYVVPNPKSTITSKELRNFLARRLPDYMIPYAFVLLDAMPVTPNGKVDRRALPAPDRTKLTGGEIFVAPHTPVEEMLARIWAEVLGLEKIGVHDNFFELGGHSLLAVRVVARVRSAFEIELPVRWIFEMPTIAQLTEAIDEARRAGAAQAPPRIRPLSRSAHRLRDTQK
jgi:acyl-CoA synthetase (AMP-forming)/AMP-acid ligase II/acyl carrier protein